MDNTQNPVAELVPRDSQSHPLRRRTRSKPTVTLGYAEAEESFLKAQRNKTGDRKEKCKGRARRKSISTALKVGTVAYFRSIITDEAERDLWYMFMTGKQLVRDSEGLPVMRTVEVAGRERLIPVFEEVELNAIQWQAFKRAVEYKRGLPIVTVRGEGENGEGGLTVKFEMVGAAPEFFEAQGKAAGLIK